MPSYRAMARLQWDTGLPADVSVNVFHFTATAESELPNIADALTTFYASVDNAFSSLIDNTTGAHELKFYDLADPEPRAPVYEENFETPDATGSPLAPELCVTVSFQGAQVSGSPQARRRGRIYLGPLDAAVGDSAGHVDATTADLFRDAAQVLLDASQASANWNWCVYSKLDDLMVIVDNGWVDNAWDVQRRRGIPATSRLTYS